jgi:hypothetical protein
MPTVATVATASNRVANFPKLGFVPGGRGRSRLAMFAGQALRPGFLNVPRREELDERGLAGFNNLGVEVLSGEVHGAGVRAEHQTREGDGDEGDLHYS